jgi:hypothetical protein
MASTQRTCGNCGEAVGEAASSCPHCGQPLAQASLGQPEGEVYLMLVTANVLRLRRQWALAEAKCSEVLQRDAENAAAHSLMGDITRDQGKLREAIEWYKMALDRNPGSAADRKKLDALIDRVFLSPPDSALRKGLAELRRALASVTAEVRSTRPPGAFALVVGMVLVVILVIAVSTVLLGRRVGPQALSPTDAVGSGAFAARPAPSAIKPEPRPAPAPQQPTAAVEELMPRESELLELVQDQARVMDPNCQVLGAEIGPRDARASIRISMPRLSSVVTMRDSMLRVISALAHRAAAWDDRISKVQVRCDLREPGRPDQVGVVTEGTREQVTKLPEGASSAAIEKSFGFVWWAPELRE